jgi:hypothetical protein
MLLVSLTEEPKLMGRGIAGQSHAGAEEYRSHWAPPPPGAAATGPRASDVALLCVCLALVWEVY